MTRFKWLMFLVMAVLLAAMPLLGAACSKEQGEQEQITLRFASFLPAGSGLALYEDAWQAEITQRTNGQVKFENYYSATLSSAKESLDAAKTGICDIAHVAASYVTPRNDTMSAVVLPFVFTDIAVAHKTINEYCRQPVPDAEAAKEGVVYLHAPMLKVYMATKKQLTSLNDWKGLRLHTSGLQAQVQQALGATVTTLTTPEVATGLDRGTIDGVAGFGIANIIPMGIAPYIKYVTDAGLGITGIHTVMNRAVYNALPDNVKKVFSDVEKEMPAKWAAILQADEQKAITQLQAAGVSVVKAPDALITQIYQIAAPIVAKSFVTDRNSHNLPGADLWNWITSTRDKYMKEAGLPVPPAITY
jgi:TRAP-type transport system periplasmic protein